MTTPQRIASLLSSATEIVYGLDLGSRVVAVGYECDYPAEVANKPRVTVSHIDANRSSRSIDRQVRQARERCAALYEIDRARLVQLRPDLIITQAQCDVCAVKYDDVMALVQAEPELKDTQVVGLNPQCLEDIFTDIARVAEAAGCPARAAGWIAQLRERVDAVESANRRLASADRPRVACLEWLDPLMLAANWTPELVSMAGGQSVLAQVGQPSTCSSWDDFAEADPEVILIAPCGFDLARSLEEARLLPRRVGWHGISAVRNGRVWAIDGNVYLNRSGPRIVDSLEILSHLIHPQRFALPVNVHLQRFIPLRPGDATAER